SNTPPPRVDEPDAVAANAKPKLEGPGHAKPPEMLERALARLHTEAIHRFLARPENGARRMIVFPKKIESPWKDPLWSPGELSEETKIEFRNDLAKIHQESLSDFPNPLTKENGPKRPPPEPALLLDAMRQMKEKDWDIKSLDLMGLVKHD